jgi:CBS domain-containing protein
MFRKANRFLFKDSLHFRDIAVGKLFKPEKVKNTLLTASEDAIVFDTLLAMANKNIGGVIVLKRDASTQNKRILSKDMCGIFTERDYLKRVAVLGLSSKVLKMKDVMTRDVYTVNYNTPLADCMRVITEKSLRHFPVVHTEGNVEYIDAFFSIRDIIRYIYEEQLQTREYLDDILKNGV